MAKKQTLSLRIPPESFPKLEELKTLFNESGSEVVERAIDYLFERRKEAVELENVKRSQLAAGNK
ncbi:hypothetical protein GCM10028818_33260 [Spirosoma horti]